LESWTGDRYVIREEIGRGGGGIVFLAWDNQLERDVVIKKILDTRSSSAISRFQREAKITANLVHPGIVSVHELGIEPESGCPFYAMQKVTGQSLDVVLKSRSAKTENSKHSIDQELLRTFVQICRIVGFAHSRRIIHRDLKPTNLCIGKFGDVFVLDWGIAKRLSGENINDVTVSDDANDLLQSEKPMCDLTRTGDSLGTIPYMSPELAAGNTNEVDERTDVFALGIILYEIVTRVHPFRCPTPEETRQHILRSEYLPLRKRYRSIPRQLEAICDKALSIDPKSRYANASELAEDLDRFVMQGKVTAYNEKWYERLDRFANRHRPWFWALLVTSTFLTCTSIVTTTLVHQAREVERSARIFAEKEHIAKNKALANEQIAHKEAVTQLQSARDSIDTWIIGLDHDLANYPGLNEMRLSLLDRAESHYKQLTSKLTDSPLMHLEVARAEIRLGDVLSMRHRFTESQSSYEHAISLLTQYSFAESSDWYCIQQSQLALAKTGLARIYSEQTGDFEAAETLLEEAIQILMMIDPVDPEYVSSRRTLALAYLIRANSQAIHDRSDQAERSFHQALVSLQAHSHRSPFFHDSRTEAEIQHSLARWRYHRGELSLAKDAYHHVIHCFDSLLEQGRNRPDWLESRASAKLSYASCLKQLLNPNEAVAIFESAEEDLRRAWEIFSSESTHREKKSNIYSGLGVSLLLLGDSKQAEHVFQLSLDALNGSSNAFEADSIKGKLQARIWIADAQLDQFREVPNQDLREIENLFQHQAISSLSKPEYEELLYQWRWIKNTIDLRNEDLIHAEQELIEWMQEVDEQDALNESKTSQKEDTSLRYIYIGKLLRNLALIQETTIRPNDAQQTIEKGRKAFLNAKQADGYEAALAGFCLIQSWLEHPITEQDSMKAYELAKQLVHEHPASPTAWYWIGETSFRLGRLEEAQSAVRKVHRLRRQATLDDELLSVLINTGRISPDVNKKDIMNHFGIEEIPFGSHARCLLEREHGGR
jgi:tetratricopeptide (TPR) repeat protein/tRNA A-37 threonylcarbamoyl transferase component Bud32